MAADDTLRQAVLDVFSDPMNLPSTFWDYATQNWLKDAPVFPISQVFGFAQFNAQVATEITTEETSISATYGDLTTVGPQLTGLPDGKYIILFGCIAKSSAGGGVEMALQVNATSATDASRCLTEFTGYTSIMRAYPVTLSSSNNNTITAKYAVLAGSTGHWQNRWMTALKYANN